MGRMTTKAVENARPGMKLNDGGAKGAGRLLLVVGRSGAKSFIYRYRNGTHDTTMRVGTFPAMSLAEARREVERRAGGEAPGRRGGTFGALLDAYVKALKARGAVSADDAAAEVDRSIRQKPALALLLDKEARSITAADIDRILEEKSDGGRVTTRVNRLRSLLSAAFNRGRKRRGWKARRGADAAGAQPTHDAFLLPDGFNPVRDVEREAEYERKRDRVLTRGEMQAFYREMEQQSTEYARLAAALRDEKGCDTHRSADLDKIAGVYAFWCCVALTGQRVVQLLAATEDTVGGILDPDAPRRRVLRMEDKKGYGSTVKAHTLPVTAALARLWPVAERAKGADLFTVRGKANRALKRIAPGAIPMDIRRTVETLLQESGFSKDDRAALLAHGRTGVQAAHYERSEMLAVKEQQMLAVERWVCGEPPAVVVVVKKPAAERKPRQRGHLRAVA